MAKKLLLTLLFALCAVATPAQTDSVRIQGCLPVAHADPAGWITRYQKEIDAFKEANAAMGDRSCDALLMGSSSMRRWTTAHEDLAPMKIINRAYGGASIRDMIYNYDVVARGYNPKAIVLYVGNDIGDGKNNIGVGLTYDLFRVFAGMIRRDYPDVPFFIMSVQHSIRRAPFVPQVNALNALLKEYAARTPYVHFIDVTPGMYDPAGNLRTDIFAKDNLHLNAEGYKIWTAAVRPLLLEVTRGN